MYRAKGLKPPSPVFESQRKYSIVLLSNKQIHTHKFYIGVYTYSIIYKSTCILEFHF